MFGALMFGQPLGEPETYITTAYLASGRRVVIHPFVLGGTVRKVPFWPAFKR